MGSKNKNTLGLSSFVVKKGQATANFTGGTLPDVGIYAFPDASAMSCQQLEKHINDLKYKLENECLYSKNLECASSYQDAINAATEIYNTKGCGVVKNNEEPVKLPNPVLPAYPSDVIGITDAGIPIKTNVTTTQTIGTSASGAPVIATTIPKTKKFPWLLIGGIAVVAYVMFAGEKNSVG